MAIRRQAGFSLVELMLVLAITSALVVIAFAGQRGLRSQAQFDADVNKLVASIADAHNEATAAVNIGGPGDGSENCINTVVPGGKYVFAGIAWTATDAPGGGTYRMDFYAADRLAVPASACIFDTRFITTTAQVRVNKAPGTGLARALFVRDDTGGLNVCSVTSVATLLPPSFIAGGCVAPGAVGNVALILNLTDADGHASQIQVDPSGLAKRIN